jgi:ClpA/ClpB-like protein
MNFMFERYTERARRVIFFARYEASQFGNMTIDTEHLLLGLLREDRNLISRWAPNPSSLENIHNEITKRVTIREKIATSIDLPLSMECRRILAYSAEEAERLNHRHIGTEHVLLGILREEKCLAEQILSQFGLNLNVIREELARHPMPPEEDHTGAGFMPVVKQLYTAVHSAGLPKSGTVPDAETAKRIAEAVWTPQFGADTIASLQPINAILQFNVWLVTSSSPTPEGALFVFILQADGRILSVGRGPAQ